MSEQIQTGTAAGSPVWAPSEPLTIAHVRAMADECGQALPEGADWTVDLRGLERIDTAGCQLLAQLRRRAARAAHACRVLNAGPAIVETMQLLGCAEVVGVGDVNGHERDEESK